MSFLLDRSNNKRIKLFNFLLIASLGIGLQSCSTEEEDSELQISFDTKKTFMIPSKASSCYATSQSTGGDISQKYIKLVNPKLKFREPAVAATNNYAASARTLIISLIMVKIKSSYIEGGEYSCPIVDDEARYLFANNNGTPWDFYIPSENTNIETNGSEYVISSWNLCNRIACGGIKTKTDRAFSATATIEVIGFIRNNTTNEETPIKATGSVIVENFQGT